MSDRPALTIARALARTSVYYKRTALLAGAFGLCAVVGAISVEDVGPKGGLLATGLLFAVFCYRSIRASYRYVDPTMSPVLRAITAHPDKVAKVWVERGKGKPSFVHIADDNGAELSVRIEPGRVEQDVPELIEALKTRSPDAEVVA